MTDTGIYELLPDPEALLALEPEELAGVIIQYLNSPSCRQGHLNRYNCGGPHGLNSGKALIRCSVGPL